MSDKLTPNPNHPSEEPPGGDAEPDDVGIWPPPSEPMRVARRFLAQLTLDDVPLTRHWRGSWYTWVGSHWAVRENAEIRKDVYSVLESVEYIDRREDVKPWAPTRRKIGDVLEAMAAITLLANWIEPPVWVPGHHGPDAKRLVSVRNGILSVPDRELIDHDPHLFNLVSVPFDYEPDAPRPLRWHQFLAELWPDDPESIRALQQFFGYVLSGRTDQQKILLVIGPPRAGKGVIARLITALLGKDHVAGPTLSSLSTNFGLQALIGKSLAIVSDARLSGRAGGTLVERLLSISGEDRLTIDRKYQDHWSGNLSTRFIIMSNELPALGDASGAIANRFIVLVLEHSWLGKENTKLTDQLLEELPGILNWSLDGLDQLNTAGRFTEPTTSKEAITALHDLASPVAAFVRDTCELDPGYQVTTTALWDMWKQWCDNNGRHLGSRAMFGRNLSAAFPQIRKGRPREGGGRIHTYFGIRPKAHDHDQESL